MTENQPTPTPSSGFLQSLTQAETIVLGCCAFVVLACFLPWYSIDVPDEMKALGASIGSANAFDFWQGTFVFLLSIASGAALWADKAGALKMDPKTARLLPLAGCCLGALFALMYIASAKSADSFGMKAGKTLWPWACLIAMGAATYFALMRLNTAPRE